MCMENAPGLTWHGTGTGNESGEAYSRSLSLSTPPRLPPSTPATGDSRISINPDYKSNSLNTKVTRKGNPVSTPLATTTRDPRTPPSSARARHASVSSVTASEKHSSTHAHAPVARLRVKYQTGQRTCINFPRPRAGRSRRFSRSLYAAHNERARLYIY